MNIIPWSLLLIPLVGFGIFSLMDEDVVKEINT